MSDDLTVEQFTQSWLPAGWTFDTLFEWPPDVFAWTSSVLQRSGAYRLAVSPPCAWPDSPSWRQINHKSAAEWLDWVSGKTEAMPSTLERYRSKLAVTSPQITFRALSAEDCKDVWPFCQALLELHAIADRCCVGFGSPGINYKYSTTEVQFLADTLLARYGSISRLPKHVGLVLPKMRTPQNGVTLRALSLYATFHQSEIEIAWRSMPWVNIDENTVNLLLVPWPEHVHATWFVPRSSVGQRIRSGRSRYFSFQPKDCRLDPQIVLDMLADSLQHVSRVHVIVLPELAITYNELAALQNALAAKLDGDRIPMIVAGVRMSADELDSGIEPRNRVVLSVFFSEKWYDLEQDKHHRWKLDPPQIQQYRLGGALTGTNSWWEGYEVLKRRLTFLAPNDWLVLSPLICEDLAQLEPVSDIIRGVGPTLVWALLLDGPQLAHRWSSRYASVLADDPGSSVLTLTALGMAERSVPRDQPADPTTSRTAALWKDRETGWQSVTLPSDASGAVLTLSAKWHEEFTLDGRGDQQNAALFVIQGMHPIARPKSVGAATSPARSDTDGAPWWHTRERRDIKELTVFTQFVDAALDAEPALQQKLAAWAEGKHWAANEPNQEATAEFRGVRMVLELIAQDEGTQDTELDTAIRLFLEVLRAFPVGPRDRTESPTHDGQLKRWGGLVDQADSVLRQIADVQRPMRASPVEGPDLEPERMARVQIAVWNAVLWAIHNRLTEERRSGVLVREGAERLGQIQQLLRLRFAGRLDQLRRRA